MKTANSSTTGSFALNYKKIPFTVVNLSLDSLELTAKSVGAAPTTTKADGTPKYTVPFIHDHNSSKTVSDSLDVAKYLDKAYPDSPKLFTEGSEKVQEDLINALTQAVGPIFPIVMLKTWDLMAEGMKEARGRRGEAAMYTSFPKFTKEQERDAWERAKKAFEDSAKRLNEDDNEYVFAKLVLAVLGSVVKMSFGEKSNEWRDMSSWAGGFVGKVTDATLGYESQMVLE
ncbi:hypothetical protein AAF712_016142 [Marasmius tenuissimus]|uniref:GST N-terminal domain-containing protein n=1 Tax=Marasmius tenuissimus TaxID=585030 RepID=A0ABR2Z6F7_9AGAR